MKMIVITLILLTISISNAEDSADIEKKSMRHGWTIFTGPKPTKINSNDKASIERGKRLYQQYCLKCHGASGKGDGKLAKAFEIKPANLSSLAKNMPNHYLVMQINEGRQNMPKWEDLLNNSQTWDLTNYIQTLGQ